jgi:hypothetical protein
MIKRHALKVSPVPFQVYVTILSPEWLGKVVPSYALDNNLFSFEGIVLHWVKFIISTLTYGLIYGHCPYLGRLHKQSHYIYIRVESCGRGKPMRGECNI